MKSFKKTFGFLLFLCPFVLAAQVSSAKITFERKTNLYKKFKGNDRVQSWIKEEDKIKIDYFELFVTDTATLFRPQESDLKENFSWTTAKNTVYQDFRTGDSYLVKTLWGEEMHLTDSVKPRKWQISESTRKIAGYTCRKAMWRANDTLTIYAWFSYDIVPSAGPESFCGLPGTILGLATEDGGVVYFAKTVDLLKVPAELLTRPKKKKVYSVSELKARLTKQYGHEKWFKPMLYEQFDVW